MSLNQLRDEALRIAVEHGFTDASVGEDIALMHSELSEALEFYREYHSATSCHFLGLENNLENKTSPMGVPIELADCVIRIAHFCGKHGIDLEEAVRIKMKYNETRPFRHGNKKL